MKLTTAGESHGKGLFAIYEGLPSNLKIDIDEINHYLNLRQSGYGRGGRQKIESDTVEILSGVRNTYTLGSPVAICVKNSRYRYREFLQPSDTSVNQANRHHCQKQKEDTYSSQKTKHLR